MGSDKKTVFFGELLMRLATKRYERFVQARDFELGYTGAEANAAVSLANYGLEAYAVSVVPDSEIGQACINYVRQFGVNTDFIKRGGKRLGTFYLETGASQRPSKVIYDRAASSITELKPGQMEWNKIFAGKNWFHWSGTAPALSECMAETTKEACIAAKKNGLMVSCDLNYRRKLWTPEKARQIMTDLMQYVDVLIGNEEDSALVLGVEAKGVDVHKGAIDVERYKEVAAELHKRFGFKYVATTLRESISASENGWSALLSDGKQCYVSKQYRIWIVDRVGGGDSFSGGLIYGLLTGMDCQKTIEFAAAASCLKHSIHGDFNHVSKEEVMALLGGDGSGRIQR
ncbi:MAG: sugar kinase [Sedimentisphaerales bacterium]|nr:sugar kinase [Sedimentisphaerales bacterium]